VPLARSTGRFTIERLAMRRVAIDDLKEGMKLARQVINNDGMVLLGQDTELNPLLIDKIQALHISSVYVHGPRKALIPKDAALAALDERFRNTEGMPHMGTIKKLTREHIEGAYEEYGSDNCQE
jgi:hypothetical protein